MTSGLARRLHGATGPDMPGRQAEAIADWGEAEFREMAEATGIPLEAIRSCMGAIQRGDETPAAGGGRTEAR